MLRATQETLARLVAEDALEPGGRTLMTLVVPGEETTHPMTAGVEITPPDQITDL